MVTIETTYLYGLWEVSVNERVFGKYLVPIDLFSILKCCSLSLAFPFHLSDGLLFFQNFLFSSS